MQQRGWALRIGQYIAKRFQDDGAVIGAVTLKKTTDKFIREQQEVDYVYIENHDRIMEFPAQYLGDDDFSLEEICREYDVNSIWPFVQSLRNHVKSYQDKYYYGFKQNIDDDNIVLFLKAIHKLCVDVFEKFKPDVIITPNFVSYVHIALYHYAKKRGVKMLGVTDSKVKGIDVFVESYFDSGGPFIDRINELNAGEKSENHERAAKYIDKLKEEIQAPGLIKTRYKKVSPRELVQLSRRMLSSFIRQKNRLQGFGSSIDALSPAIHWRDYWKSRAYTQAANSFDYYDFEKTGQYAFMPLQFQPEANIDVFSPRYNNQIETARQIAMSLPGDMTLVVKDHPAMLGYRSPEYLEKVARTPNVKLIDYRIPAGRVLANAKMLIAPTGTIFFEAAVLKLPSILLGDIGTVRLLPNVVLHSDFSTLDGKIVDVLKTKMDEQDYNRKLNNYVAAAYDVGFDINWIGIWERGEKGNMDDLYKLFYSYVENYVQR
ncbi:MAG: hypothetical protein OEZ39_09435 [Gammaproteobacteria bacterium]|nr:hypothetical protein [Gammaproteobacteria bacterium]MDH5652066.1 hypothetical protein [Gammaproteobacteria bacterium]